MQCWIIGMKRSLAEVGLKHFINFTVKYTFVMHIIFILEVLQEKNTANTLYSKS